MPGGVSISGCIRALADDRQNGSDDLDRRIAQAKAAHEVPAGRAGGSAETKGWAVGVEFVGTVLVAALIGFLLDKGLGTAPWLMIVRSEEHTSELQSLMRISYAVFCLKKNNINQQSNTNIINHEK